MLLLAGYRQDETRYWDVHYEIYKYTNDPISYRVTYYLPNGSTKTLGPITDFKWESEKLSDFEEFSSIELSVEVLSGDDALMLQIYRQDALHESGVKPAGTSKYTIETIL